MGAKPHVLAIPYPAQGHVIPLMELSQWLVKHGFKVTFVNTNFNHKRVMDALAEKNNDVDDQIHLVSIPDGLEPWDDRNDRGKLAESIFQFMPGNLTELIENINNNRSSDSDGHDKVTCVIADECMGWALEVAEKMRIKRVAFWTASSAGLGLIFSIPKLIEDGIINHVNGTPVKNQMIQLSPTMPFMCTEHFTWACVGDLTTQKTIFQLLLIANNFVKLADWVICNSIYELEPAAFTFSPEIVPVGPLLASNRLGKPEGHFWPEDSTCLTWLDQQPASSVIYVAFGSFTVFDQTQFQELAMGLELTNKPFLWVVRPDITDDSEGAYPDGFLARVGTRGKMVGWAPQQKVLSHPSVACFVSHCGWNSTMEGLCNGVPFLCWPYFADQFLNQSYICDVWKIGLGFERDEKGIVTREEIRYKVERLLSDKAFKARTLNLKDITIRTVREGGSSYKNFNNFIDWMK